MLDVSTLFHKESVCIQEKREDKEERREFWERRVVKCVEHTPYLHVNGRENKVCVGKGKEDPHSN
jgi:hypothetical protein